MVFDVNAVEYIWSKNKNYINHAIALEVCSPKTKLTKQRNRQHKIGIHNLSQLLQIMSCNGTLLLQMYSQSLIKHH